MTAQYALFLEIELHRNICIRVSNESDQDQISPHSVDSHEKRL